MKTSVVALLLSILIATSEAAAADIVIAQVADFSASRAALGKAMRAGAQMAFARANADGSLGGGKIRFVTFDDQYKPDETVRILGQVLAEQKPALVLGLLGTANTGAANLRAFRYGLSVNDVPSIISTAGLKNARGFGQVQVMPDPTSGCKINVCRKFNADYKQFGEKAIKPSPSMMEGYLAAQLAIEAIRTVKGNVDNKSVQEALNRIGQLDLGGFVLDFANGQRAGSKHMDLGIISRSGQMMY